MYQLLGSPYQDLWLHWLDQGNDAYKQQAKDSNQQRLDFVRSIVAAAATNAGAASQNGSAEHEAAAANGVEAAPQVQFMCRVNQDIMVHALKRTRLALTYALVNTASWGCTCVQCPLSHKHTRIHMIQAPVTKSYKRKVNHAFSDRSR